MTPTSKGGSTPRWGARRFPGVVAAIVAAVLTACAGGQSASVRPRPVGSWTVVEEGRGPDGCVRLRFRSTAATLPPAGEQPPCLGIDAFELAFVIGYGESDDGTVRYVFGLASPDVVRVLLTNESGDAIPARLDDGRFSAQYPASFNAREVVAESSDDRWQCDLVMEGANPC